MTPNRWDRILAEVRTRPPAGPLVAHLCAVARRLMPFDHVSIALHTAQGLVTLEGSDPTALAADRLQALWGAGPSISAAAESPRSTGPAIVVHDVTTEVDPRWPVLGELDAALGLRALTALPLRSGGAHLGALTGYSHRAQAPTSSQLADGLVLGTLITEVLLGLRATEPPSAAPGAPPPADTQAHILEELLRAIPQDSVQVHQAAGMVAERLHITIIDAQIRLRALAFRRGDTLEQLARQVLSDVPIPELEE